MSRTKRGTTLPKGHPKYKEAPYWQSAAYNDWLYDVMLEECMQLALTRFEWRNMPPTVDTRYLELALLEEGRATLAIAPSATDHRIKGAVYSLRIGGGPGLDMYGDPTSWRAVGANGTNFEVTARSGEIVYDNSLKIPMSARLAIYARELADIYRTRQINRLHQKVPVLIKTDQDHVEAATQLYANAAGNEPATIVDDSFSNYITLEAIKVDAPWLGGELDAQERSLWNRVYTSLGISNVPVKAERMIEDEVTSASEPASLMALDCLRMRREALDRFNRRFRTDYGPVVWRQDFLGDNDAIARSIEKRMEVLSNVV